MGSGDAGEGGGATQSRRGPQAPAPAFELPPEIQADRYLLQAEQAVREGDAAGVRAAMERLESLGREHGLEPAPEDHFRYAQAWAAAGEAERAMEAVVRYLRIGGREAEHYRGYDSNGAKSNAKGRRLVSLAVSVRLRGGSRPSRSGTSRRG